jgi:hypothetical protein|tara:strand:- start:544 stop:690 length:147 start_codon:yes stop_codon:yes gene_type:complete
MQLEGCSEETLILEMITAGIGMITVVRIIGETIIGVMTTTLINEVNLE